MSKWDNFYKDWGNPTKEDMEKLGKLVKKFITTAEKLQKEKKEKEKHPLFYWRQTCKRIRRKK